MKATAKKSVKVRVPRAKKAERAAKTARPPRLVRQLTRFVTRLDRMAARALVLKERAAKRKSGTAAAESHEKAHGVLTDAKARIEQIAKGVGA